MDQLEKQTMLNDIADIRALLLKLKPVGASAIMNSGDGKRVLHLF